jgi:hypothetical protein
VNLSTGSRAPYVLTVPYFWFEKAFETSKVPPNPDILVSLDSYSKNIRICLSKNCLNC